MNAEKELWKSYRIYPLSEAVLIGSFVCLVILSLTQFIYDYALNAQKGEIKQGLLRTVAVINTILDHDEHESLTIGQETSKSYLRQIKPLEDAQEADKSIEYLYTAILKEEKVYFILDATPAGEDKAAIMQEYLGAPAKLIQALTNNQPEVTDEPYVDAWGSHISAYVPFSNQQGEMIGVLGIDITADDYNTRLEPIRRATTRTMVAGFFISFFVGSIVWFMRNFGLKINLKRKELAEQVVRNSIHTRSDNE